MREHQNKCNRYERTNCRYFYQTIIFIYIYASAKEINGLVSKIVIEAVLQYT